MGGGGDSKAGALVAAHSPSLGEFLATRLASIGIREFFAVPGAPFSTQTCCSAGLVPAPLVTAPQTGSLMSFFPPHALGPFYES